MEGDLHYVITEARSVATRVWIQHGIRSRTETVPDPRPAPRAARECATKLQEWGFILFIFIALFS